MNIQLYPATRPDLQKDIPRHKFTLVLVDNNWTCRKVTRIGAVERLCRIWRKFWYDALKTSLQSQLSSLELRDILGRRFLAGGWRKMRALFRSPWLESRKKMHGCMGWAPAKSFTAALILLRSKHVNLSLHISIFINFSVFTSILCVARCCKDSIAVQFPFS